MERIDRGDGFIQVIKTLKEILGFEIDYKIINKNYPFPRICNKEENEDIKHEMDSN